MVDEWSDIVIESHPPGVHTVRKYFVFVQSNGNECFLQVIIFIHLTPCNYFLKIFGAVCGNGGREIADITLNQWPITEGRKEKNNTFHTGQVGCAESAILATAHALSLSYFQYCTVLCNF